MDKKFLIKILGLMIVFSVLLVGCSTDEGEETTLFNKIQSLHTGTQETNTENKSETNELNINDDNDKNDLPESNTEPKEYYDFDEALDVISQYAQSMGSEAEDAFSKVLDFIDDDFIGEQVRDAFNYQQSDVEDKEYYDFDEALDVIGKFAESKGQDAQDAFSKILELLDDDFIGEHVRDAFNYTGGNTQLDGFRADGYLYLGGRRYYYAGPATQEQIRLTGGTGFGFIYGGHSHYVYNGSLYKIANF